jgi:hypothetical protein
MGAGIMVVPTGQSAVSYSVLQTGHHLTGLSLPQMSFTTIPRFFPKTDKKVFAISQPGLS